jgi:predicted nuclease of predicted toxin-antitoxin system
MTGLLFDQNLSPRLVALLRDLLPGSTHVEAIRLGRVLDKEVWEYARQHDLVIVSKDADFSELSLLWGFPPKVIWIRRGNCSTQEIERLLRGNVRAIRELMDDEETGILTLF